VNATLPALPIADADQTRIEALRRMPPARAGKAAAAELQVVFMQQLLAAMRRTIPESDFLPRSPARSMYEGMFDHTVAEALAARDPFGLVGRLGEAAGLKILTHPADEKVGDQSLEGEHA
jgi:Rod binding domain-containing protein